MKPIEEDRIASMATAAVEPKVRRAVATRLEAGVLVPDTPLVTRAIEYVREHSEPYLFNHVMRSWLFAVSLAELNQAVYDGEVLAVAKRVLRDARERGARVIRLEAGWTIDDLPVIEDPHVDAGDGYAVSYSGGDFWR